MLYVAVFNDGQISLIHSSRSQLEAHNAFRLNKLHSIIQAENKDALKSGIKISLQNLRC